MTFKTKTLCLLLAISSFTTYEIRPNRECYFVGQPALQEYQELGKEAQFALGIPERNHVPIKRANPNEQRPNIVAYAKRDGIYVYEEKLNHRPYGMKRFFLFHEAAHIKYRDHSSSLSSKAIERRADRQGGLATKCAACIRETELCRWPGKSKIYEQGYITANELEDIAQYLDRQGEKMCPYHSQRNQLGLRLEMWAIKTALNLYNRFVPK